MGVVILQAHEFRAKRIKRVKIVRERNGGERIGSSRQLFFHLRAMIFVHMYVAKCMHKFSHFSPEDFCDYLTQKCVTSDVKRYSQKYICASLIQLKANFSMLYIDLIHIVANREARTLARFCHCVQIFRIPRRNERVVGIRILTQFIYYP